MNHVETYSKEKEEKEEEKDSGKERIQEMNQHLYQVNGKGLALGSVSIVLARDSDHDKRLHKQATRCEGQSAKRMVCGVRIFVGDKIQEGLVLYSWNGDY